VLNGLLAGAAAAQLAAPLAAFAQAQAQVQAKAPEPVRRSLRTSDGVTLSCLDSGGGGNGAPPLVLVPGWCMPAAIWRPQIDALGTRYRVLALDPRGQGESEVAPTGYTADRRAADIDEFIAPLGRVVLVAWSLAVLEALQLAYRFGTGAIAALVLVDNSVGEPPVPPSSDFIARLRADRRATVDRFVPAMFAHPRPPEEITALTEAALRVPLDASIALLSYPFPREHWRDIARALPVPLAYVTGAGLAAQGRSLAAHRPTTEVDVFEHAGHALFVDEPARFNALLAAVVERVTPAA
jgi:non-heme chloroperoxidase